MSTCCCMRIHLCALLFKYLNNCQWHTEGGGVLGCSTPPLKFRRPRYTSHILKHTFLENLGLKFYQCLTLFQSWRRPQPPPPPLDYNDDDDDDNNWLSWRERMYIYCTLEVHSMWCAALRQICKLQQQRRPPFTMGLYGVHKLVCGAQTNWCCFHHCTVFTDCSGLLTFCLSSCVLAPVVSKGDAWFVFITVIKQALC